jgi:hypothetical protein
MLENVTSRIRIVLAWSFGALILLTAATGVASLIVFEKLRGSEASLRTRFAERIALLDRIRNGVYLSGGLARDYLAAHDIPAGPAILAQLDALEAETQQAAARYADSPAGVDLRAEVMLYWKTIDLMTDVAISRPRSIGIVGKVYLTDAACAES